MTQQLGPFPTALQTPYSRTHSVPSRGRGPETCRPTVKPASLGQQQQEPASRPCQPAGKKLLSKLLRPRSGSLSLLHEAVCPLHLELARVDPIMASLVMAMLRYDPQQRVSAGEALSHPFLRELNPVLHLLAANREAADTAEASQGRAGGSTDTQAQGVLQQGCQAEGSVLGQAVGTVRSELQPALPFKPEPRRQPIASLPTQSRPTALAAARTWGVGRLPLPSDPLLQATQPHPQAAQPQLQTAQPQPRATQPQLQANQPQLQPQQGTSQLLLPGQGPVTSLPSRAPGTTASSLERSATASANSQQPAAASATARHQRHKPLEVTAHQGSSWGGQQGTVVPAVVPSGSPSADKGDPGVALSGAAAYTLPAQQAGYPSAPPGFGGSPPTAELTAMPRQPRAAGDAPGALSMGQDSPDVVPVRPPGALGGQGQDGCSAGEALHAAQQVARGLGGVATPQALAQGSAKTPGLVKAWQGVSELLQQMSPGSQVISGTAATMPHNYLVQLYSHAEMLQVVSDSCCIAPPIPPVLNPLSHAAWLLLPMLLPHCYMQCDHTKHCGTKDFGQDEKNCTIV